MGALSSHRATSRRTLGPLERAARRLLLGRLAPLARGRLVIRDALGEEPLGPPDAALRVTLTVHDPLLYRRVALRGVLGAGEAYAAGAWSVDDLPGLVRILLRNRKLMERVDGVAARALRPLRAALGALVRTSRGGRRRNVKAHYDLGNDFFRLFLDDTMAYSAGIFEHEGATLREASLAKFERLARQLELEPGHHVLEIGCGWGGFALYLAQHHGCRVTATTLSPSQAAWARDRVRAAGLTERVTILERDYRDLEGTYDRVASVEMIEAVGHAGLGAFARLCRARLAAGGRLVLQMITIDDRHYDRARRTVDFIKRHIFPGSFIPSFQAVHAAFVRHSDLRLVDVTAIGPHYARTLAAWRERFHAHADAVRALGFPETFLRSWDYYFAYCEGGFHEGFLDDLQVVFVAP